MSPLLCRVLVADPRQILHRFWGPQWTLVESTVGPLESAGKLHLADSPEARQKSARIRLDPLRPVMNSHLIAHLIAL